MLWGPDFKGEPGGRGSLEGMPRFSKGRVGSKQEHPESRAEQSRVPRKNVRQVRAGGDHAEGLPGSVLGWPGQEIQGCGGGHPAGIGRKRITNQERGRKSGSGQVYLAPVSE